MLDFLRGSLFLAIAMVFLYEFIAVAFPTLHVPSISFITYGSLSSIKPLAQIVTGFLIGTILTLLGLHLTGELSFWKP